MVENIELLMTIDDFGAVSMGGGFAFRSEERRTRVPFPFHERGTQYIFR